jgi:phage I-like protein
MIDLGSVKLAEGSATTIKALPIGRYSHPIYGELAFTRERLQRYADNVNRRVRGIDLSVDYEHRTDPTKGKRAAGWIQSAEVKSDGLYLAVSFTDEAKAEIRRGAYRYWSPELKDTWTNPRTGETHTDVLLGGGITNRPYLNDLPAVAASESAMGGRPVKTRLTAIYESAQQMAEPPERQTYTLPPRDRSAVQAFLDKVNRATVEYNLSDEEALNAVALAEPDLYRDYRNATFLDGRI